jgi:predicted AlkP superfamily pyrophosphatase or phosphodiesterase
MKLRWHYIIPGLFIVLGLFFNCSRRTKPSIPRLTVVIVVDQMRYDYLVRFAGLFSGGLAKLMREGAVFTKARHDHANTETAPGHATLLTGSHPSHHGIVGNDWYHRSSDRRVYCVDDSSSALVVSGRKNGSETPTNSLSLPPGKSPRPMLRHTLGDWLKTKYPRAKIISVGGKDRSAILTAGFNADAAYWYHAPLGSFVSSTYYLAALPDWAAKWNAARHANRYHGKAWEKLRPETDYFVSREDLFSAEGDGRNTTFPHQFITEDDAAINAASPPADFSYGDSTNARRIDPRFYDWLANTPFVDALTLEFARQAIQAESLGADNVPDLLCIALKATDAVGHRFGPLSQESEDNLLRLDDELGRFFEFLEAQIGLKNCLIALSADHGVLPLPEELRRRGFEAARISEDEAINEVLGVQAELQQEWRTNRPITRNLLEGITPDYRVADSLGLSPAEFRLRIAARLRSLSFVDDVYTCDELQSSGESGREYVDEYRHSFHPERSPDLWMRFKPYYLISHQPYGTTHGSPYDYDTHVPIIFWGARVRPGRIDTPHKTIDFAPTLAHLLNLDLSGDLQRRVDSGRPGAARIESGFDGEILTMAIQE